MVDLLGAEPYWHRQLQLAVPLSSAGMACDEATMIAATYTGLCPQQQGCALIVSGQRKDDFEADIYWQQRLAQVGCDGVLGSITAAPAYVWFCPINTLQFLSHGAPFGSIIAGSCRARVCVRSHVGCLLLVLPPLMLNVLQRAVTPLPQRSM